jgi:preprotein translocase subunit SecA
MMEAFMEEVVGFVFHLEVEATPQVGVVAGADGRAVQVGSRNGSAATDDEVEHRHLVESGPDPDGPGVVVHQVEETDEAELETVPARPQVRAKGPAPQASRRLSYSAPDEDGSAATGSAAEDDAYAGVGRNAPCPCGSGKKFKMCHGRTGAH